MEVALTMDLEFDFNLGSDVRSGLGRWIVWRASIPPSL
jgi:hypothetical protein